MSWRGKDDVDLTGEDFDTMLAAGQPVTVRGPRSTVRLMVEVDECILFYAFRYALGRQTYAVADVASALREHAGQLTALTRELVEREIVVALAENAAGDQVDREQWESVVDQLQEVSN